MTTKTVYKEHYFYPDPLSKSVANRTTRYRRKREREEERDIDDSAEKVDLGDCFEPSNNVLSGDGMFSSNAFMCGEQQRLVGAYNLQVSHALFPRSSSLLTSFGEQVEEHHEEDSTTETGHLLEDFFARFTEEIIDHSIPVEIPDCELLIVNELPPKLR